MLHQSIRAALHRSLAQGFRTPVRTALADGPARGADVLVGGSGRRLGSPTTTPYRLGLARYQPDDLDHLGY